MPTDVRLSRRGLLTGCLAAIPLAACGSGGSGTAPLGSGPLAVLVLFKGPVIPDATSKLLATGLFAAVDQREVSGSTPTLTQLLAYDVVLLVGDGPFHDPVQLGDVLASALAVGRGVVVADFLVTSSVGAEGLDGAFDTANYHAIPDVPTSPPRGADAPFGGWPVVMDDPVHPIVTGGSVGAPIPTGPGDYGSFRPATPASWTSAVPGAVQVAHWDDGAVGGGNANATGVPTPLIVTRDVFPSTGVVGRRVDLGLHPQAYGPWTGLVHPDAHRIYVNALLYAGYRI